MSNGKEEETSKSRSLRSGSLTSKNEDSPVTMTQIEDLITRKFQEILEGFETKITAQLDMILSKMSAMEERMDAVQTEQVRINIEMDKVKNLVVEQQRILEKYESERRLPNLIISGIPESPIRIETDEFDESKIMISDDEKLQYICKEICETDNDIHISSSIRLGKKSSDRPRIMKVCFPDISVRNRMLRFQKQLRDNDTITNAFCKIYVKPDSTYLVRQEEKRLRDMMRDMKKSAHPRDKFYIKKGQLFQNSAMVDKIDIRNQLF